jgi:SAM-dependent methyltransferase
VAGDQVRARVEVRPYGVEGGPPWWAVSDFGSDVRAAPLREDHVLGIGAASLLLAQVTMRRPVARALDLGTGCGVQALHLATHATSVLATDVSRRALRFAATTAALSGQRWELREGPLFEPLGGEVFDTVVANPPFVVSPGTASAGSVSTRRYEYRDSGLAGDAFSEQLVRGVPRLLAPGGTASLLANWVLRKHEGWDERLVGWLAGSGCDAWIWQRDVMEPGAYVSLWLRDAGERPGTLRWEEQYDGWRDWFDRSGTAAVGMGVISLRRTDRAAPVVVCEDVPQMLEQPIAGKISGWFDRADWLARHDDARLLEARLRRSEDLARVATEQAGDAGWQPVTAHLHQTSGMHWQVEVDDAVSALVAACDGDAPVSLAVSLLAATTGAAADAVWGALAPVIRDLVARGFLEPVLT